MSIALACGACGQRYDLADEHAGKKFNCKKCGAQVVIPVPRKPRETVAPAVAPEPDPFADLDDMEDDEVAADMDEDSEAAEEEESEYVRPAFTPSRRGAGKSAKQTAPAGPNWLLIGGIAGGTVVLGVLIGLGVWAFRSSGGVAKEDGVNPNEADFQQTDPSVEQEKNLKQSLAGLKEIIAMLREVKDAESAKSVAARLKTAMGEQSVRARNMMTIVNPDKKKEKELRDKYLAENQAVLPDFMKELTRIQTIPGSEVIAKAFVDFMKEQAGQTSAPNNGVPTGYPGAENAAGARSAPGAPR